MYAELEKDPLMNKVGKWINLYSNDLFVSLDTPTEHSNTSTPTVPVSNTYKEYITPLTRTVTYSTNFSSNSSLPQEDYYYSTLIQDNINTLSSPPEPTGLYMNPAYGSKCNN